VSRPPPPAPSGLSRRLAAFRQCFDPVLANLLKGTRKDAPDPADEPGLAQLREAMTYAALGEGKRMRPYVLEQAAQAFKHLQPGTRRAGVSLELVHAYSLVHDDLPCMDDDALRRGRPTCHVVYGEAIAVLAGNALLSLAFEILASPDTHPDPCLRCRLVADLGVAAGRTGMLGGQAVDISNENALSQPARLQMARRKTGALFGFAAEAGALLGGADDRSAETFRAFGEDLGLLFQIADDLLDLTGSEKAAGKRLRKDAAEGKPTLPALVGIEQTREMARSVAATASDRLPSRGAATEPLREILQWLLDRCDAGPERPARS